MPAGGRGEPAAQHGRRRSAVRIAIRNAASWRSEPGRRRDRACRARRRARRSSAPAGASGSTPAEQPGHGAGASCPRCPPPAGWRPTRSTTSAGSTAALWKRAADVVPDAGPQRGVRRRRAAGRQRARPWRRRAAATPQVSSYGVEHDRRAVRHVERRLRAGRASTGAVAPRSPSTATAARNVCGAVGGVLGGRRATDHAGRAVEHDRVRAGGAQPVGRERRQVAGAGPLPRSRTGRAWSRCRTGAG